MNQIALVISKKRILLGLQQHFANLAQFYESLHLAAERHYQKSGLTYVDVPEIVGITGACENVDTLFKVGNRLDLPLFFTQTGQLALEQALQSFPGAYTVIHSGRDEEEEDERHLRQFRLTEEEFDATMVGMNRKIYDEDKMFESLLAHIQQAIQAMVKEIVTSHSGVLKKMYQRDVAKLDYASHHNFLRISYEEAVKLINNNGFADVRFGEDLKADHEATIVKFLNQKNKTELPVFITHYPKEIKFFNMKVSTKDARVVLSADCIFPYAGEAVGSAVREDDFAKLNDRLLTSTMYKLHLKRGGTYEDFGWYLDIIKNQKTQPHAGYGIGNERVMQYVLGNSDIRTGSLFSLLARQSGDWDRKRYGLGRVISAPKKHILFSVGKEEDKKKLLPHIKKLAAHATLYATEHTHQYLKAHGVLTSLVYKISQIGKQPNIADLLSRRVFDLVVNIPTREKISEGKEFTDGKLIRKGAIDMGLTLITDVEVAETIIDNIAKNKS
ncbi:hypothetical protein HY086_06465 [Candidatus Gottesmanbacteria bacterium]|nr:hypothetical protein [Candidatus Gottesmanbacteria bacterium]